MPQPQILSIQVGTPRTIHTEQDEHDAPRTWRSAIYKSAVGGPVHAGKLTLTGDGQADHRVHGGPDRPILMYASEHYSVWRAEREGDFPYGAFGENLTLSGLTEDDICLGDTWAAGEVLMQVSQPRQPCFKLARRLGWPQIIARVLETGWGGWYMRVLNEGPLEAGMTLKLAERVLPRWTVTEANNVMNHRKKDAEAAAELAVCEFLSADWRNDMAARAAKLAKLAGKQQVADA